jgi:hypothetical protein
MKWRPDLRRASLVAMLLGASACATHPSPGPGWAVGSRWRFTITGPEGHAPQVVTFVVTAEKANACMGGDWRRLRRLSGSYERLSEPAYSLEGDHLDVLLASDICDAYRQLDGHVEGGRFSGRHASLGLGGTTDLGTATAVRLDQGPSR